MSRFFVSFTIHSLATKYDKALSLRPYISNASLQCCLPLAVSYHNTQALALDICREHLKSMLRGETTWFDCTDDWNFMSCIIPRLWVVAVPAGSSMHYRGQLDRSWESCCPWPTHLRLYLMKTTDNRNVCASYVLCNKCWDTCSMTLNYLECIIWCPNL